MLKPAQKGYSFIELVIAISIIGILAATAAVKISSQTDYQLNVTARKMIADTHFVQSFCIREGKGGAIYFVNGPLPGGCFIATVCYGSASAPAVTVFRNFRERILRGNPLGERFIEWYEAHGPPAAETLQRHPWLKTPLRAVLTPLAILLDWLFGEPVQAGGLIHPPIPGEPNSYYAQSPPGGTYIKDPEDRQDLMRTLPNGIAITSNTISITFNSRGIPSSTAFTGGSSTADIVQLNNRINIRMSKVTGECWIYQ